MKRIILGLTVTMFFIVALSSVIFASNGDDWLIIKKRSEAVSAASETEKEKRLKTIPFSKLYAEEDLRKRTTVPFKELYVKPRQSGEKVVGTQATNVTSLVISSVRSGLSYIVANGDTVSKIFKRFCDRGHWKTISSDNGLNQNHTIYPGQKLFIRDELVKEAYRDPLTKLLRSNERAEQLKERVDILEQSTQALKERLDGKEKENTRLTQLVNSMEKQYAKRVDTLKKEFLTLEQSLAAEETENNSLAQQAAVLKSQLFSASQKNVSALSTMKSKINELAGQLSEKDQIIEVISGKIESLESFRGEIKEVINIHFPSVNADLLGMMSGGLKDKLNDLIKLKGFRLNMIWSVVGLILLIVSILVTFVFGVKLNKTIKGNSELRTIMRNARLMLRFDRDDETREFAFYCPIDTNGQYNIAPFKWGNEILIREKDTARKAVRYYLKKHLDGGKASEVDEAIKSGRLVELSREAAPQEIVLEVVDNTTDDQQVAI